MTGPFKLLIICCTFLALHTTATAEIYKYTDESGQLVFVDDKDKIPMRFQERTSTVSEADNTLSEYESVQREKAVDLSTVEVDSKQTSQRKNKKNKFQTPVAIKGNRVLVPAEVTMGNRSVKLTLLLDTGASATVFHRTALAGLELPKGRTYKARVAGGGIVKSKKMRFRKFNVGPFQINDQAAMVINLNGREVPFDGMLGMDFLKSHPYQIDFEKQLIQWQKPQ